LKVSLLTPYGSGVEECFTMPVDLDSGGYLVVTSAAGMQEPDYHEVLNIKVLDPMFDDSNKKIEEAHIKKSEWI